MIKTYRKIPVTIQAVQWDGRNYTEVCKLNEQRRRLRYDGEHKTLTIETLEGEMAATLGDYIIKGVEGELYPCKPSVFEKTYAEVKMQIKFKPFHPAARVPLRGSETAAGYDMTCTSIQRTGDIITCGTGLAVEIPRGFFGGLYARSSVYLTGWEKVGGVTVIDSDYRDAAEFEARVAEKLASDIDIQVETYEETYGRGGHSWFFLLMKFARLAVEAEMEAEGK